ncbi:molybdopterin-dependent oxidoreductase [Pseudenhygromyxa sp. WMMC2535]|uniref:molybdopterin-dependent oxidoreductase n=1 Tax=Pseudenhygromyxa sp. WMMC2535 TaxID=2712867 RepID=UPI0015523E3A|nr:molybdopterin-dependent oxidoreductase [Pseudenhygromyxa sp. WMMC2535]NVB43206.1 molybdopterin-dependent oxidoreductase [Pseudenhygromyxa sp. WMMC2535]
MRETALESRRREDRRRFIRLAGAGTVIAALGAWYVIADDEKSAAARAERLPDGRARLPPGQKVIDYLEPMGGAAGSPNKSGYRLRVHGEVEAPFELDFGALLDMPQHSLALDVHCVTGWSRLGARWTGVSIAELAARARPRPEARHVIFEAAHGYTANVRLEQALAPEALVAHRYEDEALAGRHGAPARALVPALYFWKSAKWLRGIRFVARDEPGYWERRGYHNHADPWREERYG